MIVAQLEAYRKEISDRKTINRDDVMALESLVNDKFITNSIALEQFSKSRTTLFRSEVLEKLDEIINKEKSVNKELNMIHKLSDMESYYENLAHNLCSEFFDKDAVSYYANFKYLQPNDEGGYEPLSDFTPFEDILKNTDMTHCPNIVKRYEDYVKNPSIEKEGIISNVIYHAYCYGDSVEENNQPAYSFFHSKNADLQDIKFLNDNFDTIASGLKNIVKHIKELKIDMLDVNKKESWRIDAYVWYSNFSTDFDRYGKYTILDLFRK